MLDLRMGDVVRMRRKHPCGGFDWDVVRLGADIGLRCRTCGRRVLMEQRTFARRARAVVERGAAVDPAVERALWGDFARRPGGDEPEAQAS